MNSDAQMEIPRHVRESGKTIKRVKVLVESTTHGRLHDPLNLARALEQTGLMEVVLVDMHTQTVKSLEVLGDLSTAYLLILGTEQRLEWLTTRGSPITDWSLLISNLQMSDWKLGLNGPQLKIGINLNMVGGRPILMASGWCRL